jgi:hypothetical protein
MIRTQISLPEEQMARLREAAERRGTSIAAVVREAVDKELASDPQDREVLWERALQAVGRFRGDGAPVAENHDEYLDEIFGAKIDGTREPQERPARSTAA